MTLLEILQTKRADNSIGDYLFRAAVINELIHLHPVIIGEGNIYVTTDPTSTILFCAHLDSCHSRDESDGSLQQITNDFGLVGLIDDKEAHCLGADDGVGIWILLEMIKANVPGGYLFCTSEEVGARGSRTAAADKVFTHRFDMTVAFDRAVHPGQAPEVIVTQGGQDCASVQCGKALAGALNSQHDFGYYVSHNGVFTDTKNFRGVIAENFNLGSAYYDQHSPYERVDIEMATNLKNAAIKIDWAALPIARKLGMQHTKSDFGLRVVAGNEYADWAAGIAAEDANDDIVDGDDQVTRAYVEKTISEAMASGDYVELAHIIVMIGAEDYCAPPTESELAIIQDVNDIMDNMPALTLEESLGICLEDLEYGISPEIVLSCLYEDLVDATRV